MSFWSDFHRQPFTGPDRLWFDHHLERFGSTGTSKGLNGLFQFETVGHEPVEVKLFAKQ